MSGYEFWHRVAIVVLVWLFAITLTFIAFNVASEIASKLVTR